MDNNDFSNIFGQSISEEGNDKKQIYVNFFRTIVETSNEGIISIDRESKTRFVNKRFIEMLGYSEQEIMSRPITDFMIEEDIADHSRRLEKRQMLLSETYNRRFLKKDGTIIWTHISATPIVNSAGELVGSFGMVSDITDVKRSEMETLKFNRLYRTLSACNESLVQAKDESELLHKICNIIVTLGGYRMVWVGYAQDDPDKTVKPVAYAGTGSDYLEKIKVSWGDNAFGRGPTGKAIRSAKVQALNYYSDEQYATWRKEAESHGYASSAAFPLAIDKKVFGALNIYSGIEEVFNEGELSLLQELASDLSYGINTLRTRIEMQKLNQTLEQRVNDRTSQLEQLNKDLEAFSYTVSHDLQSPLNRINGYLELLKSSINLQGNSEGENLFIKISESLSHMNQLIEDILAFSVDSSKQIKSTNVDLTSLLHLVIEDFESETNKRRIEWTIDALPNIKCDKNLIRLVFQNLLSNALKFTANNSLTSIKVSYYQNNSENVFYVQDNGIGFDMNKVGNLFDSFQRLHPELDYQGSGIGLATVRRIIDRHGGRTWAEGELNKGATFYFSLPNNVANH